jgi:hypothetical protein
MVAGKGTIESTAMHGKALERRVGLLVPTQNIQHRVIFQTRGPLLLGLYDRGNHMGARLHLVKDYKLASEGEP